jgi:hypothetical protein
MPSHQVREVATPFNLGGGFRDELIATAMTLSLLVVGSFVLTEVFFGQTAKEVVVPENQPQTLGVSDQPERIDLIPSPTPLVPVMPAAAVTASGSATPSATVKVATEGAVVAPVVPFGEDGFYDYSAYSIGFKNPRVVFDAQKNNTRKLVVEVEITNKTVLEGLEMRLFASIVKDGVVIVPKAVMHVPNRQMVATNQQAVFQAEITLIEATDVRELRFEPGGDIPPTSHFLYQ